MNFAQVKEIVKYLKKMLPCNVCQKRFSEEGIQVLSTFHTEALFHFECDQCVNQLIVHVSIIEQNEKSSRLNIQAKHTSSISPNEVLDIHDFLTQFNGDFKSLFSSRQ